MYPDRARLQILHCILFRALDVKLVIMQLNPIGNNRPPLKEQKEKECHDKYFID